MSNLLSAWQNERPHGPIIGRGEPALLDGALTAFFASRQCPGSAIHAAMDWAMQQAKMKAPVISGFHSPLERSVLEILLVAKSPATIVLARNATNAALSPEQLVAIKAGHLLVVSAADAGQHARLTSELAQRRNELAVALAQKIIVAHASSTGSLRQQVEQWRVSGRTVEVLGPNARDVQRT